ncbi:VapE domain-containing protein [uncultured Draconibacterium sp.]|uniref:VapE domain-containing protein n=1 Tax=uncultured Draconibacterium sp. TaxID=1573823 RepID=UPI0025FBA9DB|nr:VapE domain-containing protein [uncultured Draconibacterium sp.]
MSKFQPITLPNKSQSNNSIEESKMEDYIPTARQLLEAAGADVEKQLNAIQEITSKLISFENPLKMMRYIDVLCKDFKIKKEEFKIAVKQAESEKKETESSVESSALVTRVEQHILKKYEIYFNVVSNKFMYKETGSKEFTSLNEHNLYRDLQKNHLKYSLSDLKSLLKSDFVQKRNPFFEYFEHLAAWDGEDHIEKLLGYITIIDPNPNSDIEKEKERFKRMFKKMLVRSIACSLEIDFNKQCFTLVGPGQNIGKSTFLRWLCPPKLEDYLSENIGTSKDDLIALTENFIVNIDELSTLTKYDINALKSVMSKHRVKVRLPYGERAELLQRRCNFVASTNRTEFLNDETGSVRWVCFWVTKINFDYNKDIDINNVWAQAYHIFNETNYNYQLTPQEIDENEEANKSYLIRSPEMELIMKFMKPGKKGDTDIEFRTATEIITELHQKNVSNLKLNAVNVGKALKILGFIQESKYRSDIGISVKGYYVATRDGNQNTDEEDSDTASADSETLNNQQQKATQNNIPF